MNKVILIGFVGGDVTVRQGSVATFRLATTERGYTKASGEVVEDRTEWHSITIFKEDLREWAAKHIKKGASVLVEGKIHYSTYTDANGIERMGVEIVASSVSFFSIGGKKKEGESITSTEPQTQGVEHIPSPADDLPF